jgi:hypothetical protein
VSAQLPDVPQQVTSPAAFHAQARPAKTWSRAAPVNGCVGAGEPAPQHQTSPAAVRPQVSSPAAERATKAGSPSRVRSWKASVAPGPS